MEDVMRPTSQTARESRDEWREEFIRALQFRFACKVFDEKRVLPRADLEYILEAGRLAPSSLGLEPWRFLVIEDRALRRRLRPACWNQAQLTTAGAIVVITTLKADLRLESGYAQKMLGRVVDPKEDLEEALQIYQDTVNGDVTRGASRNATSRRPR
jgi:nitroreductase